MNHLLDPRRALAPTRTGAGPADAAHLSTGALCDAAGVSRGMLRLYEREGLLPEPPRTAARYRQYPASEVQRLLAIRSLKELGFTLRDIALLLAERDSGPLDAQRLQGLAQAQLVAIDARIARLQLVRGYVAAVAAGDLSAMDDPECRFLHDFLAVGADDDAPSPHSTHRPKD